MAANDVTLESLCSQKENRAVVHILNEEKKKKAPHVDCFLFSTHKLQRDPMHVTEGNT